MTVKQKEILDGVSAKELFETSTLGLTYRDFILLPGYIDFQANEVQLKTKLTKNIELKRPFVSSPMDTVTEAEMAIAQALNGGIGIIHYNNTIDEQSQLVRKVKRYENGFIVDPIVLSPKNKIKDLDEIKEKYGFSGIPITEDGTLNSKLIGIVTNRDADFEKNRDICLGQVMTKELVTIPEGIELKQANDILKTKKIGKLPVVDKNGNLVSLLSRSDLKKNKNYPDSTKDKNKRLRVGAAVSTLEESRERVASLYESGVDVIVIDSAQGNSIYQIEMIQFIKKNFKSLDVIGGNVVTRQQVRNLAEAGVDALRVGMGPGSICITQDTVSVGRSQATAVFYTSLESKKYEIPIIADGGIGTIGDILNGTALGASSCMMGFLFAGTNEAPGEYFYENGVRLKKYRGMASLEAMQAGGDKRYFNYESDIKIAQGVSGSVPARGSIFNLIPHLSQGLKLALQNIGVRSFKELHEKQEKGLLRFERRTETAQKQGSAHGLYSFQSPNWIER